MALLATAAFAQLKRESLRKLREYEDKSPKGSVDAPIVDLIRMINDHPHYVTSSSCSGRIAVFQGVSAPVTQRPSPSPSDTKLAVDGDHNHLITKGGQWLLAEHATITLEQLRGALRDDDGDRGDSGMVLFKHEPFILHVVCRDVDAAKELLQCGLACGFRESGIVLGNRKIMCAIRTTGSAMEVPLGSSRGSLAVDDAYLAWIVDIANDKFRANRVKTDHFAAAFRRRFVDAPPETMTTTMATSPSRRSALNLRRVSALLTPAPDDDDSNDPTEDTTLAPLLRRVGHSTVAYGQDLVIFGGQGQTPSGTATRLGDLVQVAISTDGAGVAMSRLPGSGPAPSARMHHSAVVVGGQMIVFGGRAGPLKCFNEVHAFDFATRTWRELVIDAATRPSPRWKHACCVVGTTMFVHGGRDATTVFGDLYALDLGAMTAGPLAWRRLDDAQSPGRFDHVAAALADGRLVFWGGLTALEDMTGADAQTLMIYDTQHGEWTEWGLKDPTQGPRAGLMGAAACVVDGQHVIICGGTAACANDAMAGADARAAPRQLFALDTVAMAWRHLGELVMEGRIANAETPRLAQTQATVIHGTCTWLPGLARLVVLGGGCQVFGFGQLYSPPVACELVVVDKSLPMPTTRAASATTTAAAEPSIPGPRKTNARHPEPAMPPPDTQADSPPLDPSRPLGVLVEKTRVKATKTLLEQHKLYDKARRVRVAPERPLPNGDAPFLVPVTAAITDVLATTPALGHLEVVVDTDAYANKYGKANGATRNELVRTTIEAVARRHGAPVGLLRGIPERYEFVGDVVLVPRGAFSEPAWGAFAREMWAAVCAATTPRLSRVARKAFIDPGEKRQSHVELLYVDAEALRTTRPTQPGWVEIRENGITYGWDLTRVMFSSGNVTEKARMAAIGCRDEVIVDLFCGIGYYVVPFLVHGRARHVHACEWNPDSVDALRFNLARNHVAHKCTVHEGDNQQTAPAIGPVADRVNLGLLPTSEKAWPLAIGVLKPTGGWLHVHDNVAVEDRARWERHVVESLANLARARGRSWRVTCEHVERVKSYAPKVDHLVADVRCVPMMEE